MANVITYPALQLERDSVLLGGYFDPNGSSAPTSVYGRGISSVAHTATGRWTVTLADTWKALFPNAFLSLATSADLNLICDEVGTSTFVVVALAAAVETDIAAATNNRIFLQILCRNAEQVVL